MTFNGEFEAHITVNLSASEEWERFRAWCTARGLKCAYIALEQGRTPSQPMLTHHGVGTLPFALQQADELCRACEATGFSVARVKIEVPPWNEDVPRDENAARATGNQYFEHHIKLLLPTGADLDALKNLVKPHGAHLSRNARRVRDDGLQERFVTQRCYHVARQEAQQRFDKLLQALSTLPYSVIETEQEYTIFDSNATLDAGWLNVTTDERETK